MSLIEKMKEQLAAMVKRQPSSMSSNQSSQKNVAGSQSSVSGQPTKSTTAAAGPRAALTGANSAVSAVKKAVSIASPQHSSVIDEDMGLDSSVLIHYRNHFYRDNYRRVLLILLVLVIANVCLAGCLFYSLLHEPTPKYFATTSNGTLIPLIPLDQPNMDAANILTWSVTAATRSLTFNFLDYRQQLNESRKYFTADGFVSFVNALKDSNNLNSVVEKHLVVEAIPTNAPVLLNEGNVNGVYSWKVQVPMLVTFQSSVDTFKMNMVVTLIIKRQSTLDNAFGIGITSFIANQASGSGV